MGLVHDGSAFSSVTYGQVEVTNLTVANPDAGSQIQDTGINLPAYSVIDYIMVKGTTNGALGGGGASAYFISNIATNIASIDGGQDYYLYASDLDNTTGPPLFTFNVYEYYTFDRFELSWFYMSPSASNVYFKVTTAGGQPATAAVVSVLLGYKTFGTS